MNICISIGHGKSAKGGYDSGALGGNYQEFKIAREIGKYIGEIFKGYDCKADVINYDATLYLTERIAHVNKHGYDLAIDNPITAAAGMRYFKDKYYLDGGKIYRCTRDDSNGQGTILHYVPSQLVGIYFEEATKS